MKWTPRRTAGLLTVGSVAALLLTGPVAAAQAGELTPQCSGGCIQTVPDGFQVSSLTEHGTATPQCSGGCAQTAPDGFQVSSTPGALTTDGNYDPH
jgi:hypothetical protein